MCACARARVRACDIGASVSTVAPDEPDQGRIPPRPDLQSDQHHHGCAQLAATAFETAVTAHLIRA